MYNQKTYRILAKHFSESINIALEFVEGANPCTDGKTIILPERINNDYIDETISTLLHETSHIRYSDFNAINQVKLKDTEFLCLNTLEDIRVDNLTLKQYPHAVDFRQKAFSDFFNRRSEDLKKENFPIKVLKGLIFKENGYSVSKIYDNDIENLVNQLTRFIDIANNAPDTESLIDPAIELTGILFKESMKKQTQSSKQDNKQQESKVDTYNRAEKLAKEANQKIEKLKKDMEQARNKLNQYNQDAKYLHRKASLNRTKAYNANNKATNAESNKDANAQDLRKKADKVKQKAEQLRNDYNKLANKSKEAYDKYCQDRDNLYYLNADRAKTRSTIIEIQRECFSNSDNKQVEILGFNSLDIEQIKDKSPINIEESPALDELIRDALILNKELDTSADEGNKLNEKRFIDIFTGDSEELFIAQEKKEVKTHIAFVVDCSGSMGHLIKNNPNTRANLAVNSCQVIADSLKKAIANNAPAEFSIYNFGRDIHKVFENSEQYNSEDFEKYYVYSQQTIGSSTNLSGCINKVSEELNEEAEGDNKVAIVLTDVTVHSKGLKKLINIVNTQGTKFIFIAIKPAYLTKEAEEFATELFRDNVITSQNNAIDIIQKVLFESL